MATIALRQLTSEQALARAAALCSASEHCIVDISDKLLRWGITAEQAGEIIDRLLDEHYIDEARYARAYARDRMRFSHWGRIKIRTMLRMQHIPDRLVRQALDSLDPEEYADVVRQVIAAKARSVSLSPDGEDEEGMDYAKRAKVIRFGLQRGFEMEEIERALRG